MYPSIHSENTQLETNKQTAQATVGSCGTTQPSLYKYHLKLAKPNDGSGIDVTTYKGHSTISYSDNKSASWRTFCSGNRQESEMEKSLNIQEVFQQGDAARRRWIRTDGSWMVLSKL